MMTAFVALAVVAMIFASGALLVDFVDGVTISGWLSLILLAFGVFGIYALIVGK